MNSLCSLGHPAFKASDDDSYPNRTLRVCHLSLSTASLEQELSVTTLERTVDSWKQRLKTVSAEHPHLLFFSSKEAQYIHVLLTCVVQQGDPSALFELGLSLSPLYQRGTASIVNLLDAIDESRAEIAAEGFEERDWPETVGHFLASVQRHLHEPPLPLRPPDAAAVHWAGLHVHTVEATSEALLMLVVRIYQRLPEPFELLWCSELTTARSMETFLERVVQHPNRCFTLLQVECLSATVQQLLLRHMLISRDASGPQNLHCAQMGPTVLQAAPWISQHKDSHTGVSRAQAALKLKSWAVGGADIRSVASLVGASGSGKTHWAKKQLADWKHDRKATCVLSITEAFSLADAAKHLHTAVLEANTVEGLGLFVHVNLGKFRSSELHEWKSLMEKINRFFFSLLVCALHVNVRLLCLSLLSRSAGVAQHRRPGDRICV